MQAREYLEQIGQLQARTDVMWRQVQSLRASLINCSAPMDADRVSHTRDVDTMGRRIAMVVDAEAQLDTMIDRLVELKRDAIAWISRIDNTQEQLYLTERYLNFRTPTSIAEEQQVSVRWVRSVVSAGLAHLQTLLDSDS